MTFDMQHSGKAGVSFFPNWANYTLSTCNKNTMQKLD